MPMTGPRQEGDYATYREVAGLVEKLRTELVAEIKTLSTNFDAKTLSLATNIDVKLTAHESEHTQHEQRHDLDLNRRANLTRWAVTSLVSGIGVIVAVYVAFRGSG